MSKRRTVFLLLGCLIAVNGCLNAVKYAGFDACWSLINVTRQTIEQPYDGFIEEEEAWYAENESSDSEEIVVEKPENNSLFRRLFPF